MSYAEAYQRAIRDLGVIGRGGASAPRRHEVALVELVFEEIQDNARQPAPHLTIPYHLGSEAEIRGLMTSEAPKDKTLRRDAFEWVEINRRIAGDNANALRPLALAYHSGTRLAADATDPEEERRLLTWAATILGYAKHAFSVDLRDCTERDARDWCLATMSERNPAAWALDRRKDDRHPAQHQEQRGDQVDLLDRVGARVTEERHADEE